MTKTIDYAYFRPNPADLVAAGVAGVCRYVAWGQGKNITKPEYDALRAVGISVMINWESTGKSWRNGYAMGVTEGREARRQARAVGHPDNRPIVQSMDEAVPAGMLNVAADYQRGFNDGGGCGPQGAYGTCLVLDHLFDLGLIVVGWQTNARGWEGNAKDCARASLLQRTTHSFPSLPSEYDESDVQHPDWGQHPFGPTPTPAPIPAESEKEVYFFKFQSQAASPNDFDPSDPKGYGVWVTDFITRRHIQTPTQESAIIFVRALGGLKTDIGVVAYSQFGGIPIQAN